MAGGKQDSSGGTSIGTGHGGVQGGAAEQERDKAHNVFTAGLLCD